jgi:hypothetical protein
VEESNNRGGERATTMGTNKEITRRVMHGPTEQQAKQAADVQEAPEADQEQHETERSKRVRERERDQILG